MANNTALQVTNVNYPPSKASGIAVAIFFNFYGDELIVLKDAATGEVYTAIDHVLRGIGFGEV